MSVTNYFQNIKEATTSIFEGLTITMSHLIRKPVTIQYPDKTPRAVTDLMPERSRSWLRVEMDTCTACLNCEKACPIDCIRIGTEKEEGVGRVMTGFDIDMAKCMYCGLCTEPCPTGAIHFIPEFERSTYSLDQLMERFIPQGEKVAPYKPPKKEKSEGEGGDAGEDGAADQEESVTKE
jgi:formate hydrogenlyase subunit 6/NADH:ubiquinone oxidoreductase subunit I